MKVGQGDLLSVCDQCSLVGHRMQDYKCLCTVVTICATLFFPKFDSSILIPLTSKSRSSSTDFLHHVRYTQDPNLVTADLQR